MWSVRMTMLVAGVQLAMCGHVMPAQERQLLSSASANAGCCGPVTEAGQHLLDVLDGMHVEHRWLANRHVHWESGRAEGRMLADGKSHTHCSAFAAAAGERLGIYLPRPPQHSQLFLASAQGRWFTTKKAADKGWVRVNSPKEAQERANRGELVVLNYINPNPKHHGHIALVRPAVKTEAALEAEGPETMQAGTHNFSDGNAVRSFHSHTGVWPDHVQMYAHPTKFSAAEIHVSFSADDTPTVDEVTPPEP